MPMIQSTLMGNLGADPEYRIFPSGKELTKLRVCSSRARQNDNGDWEKTGELWVDVECWGRLAAPAAHALRCGMSVICIGQFFTDAWEAEDSGETVRRSQIKFKAQHVGSDITRSLLRGGADALDGSASPLEDSPADTAADSQAATREKIPAGAANPPF